MGEAQLKRMRDILRILKKTYPDASCSLTYESPFQLLIATVLSAQCTDARVNKVTPELFKRYPDAQSMSRAGLDDLEELVRTTGFFRSKAKSLAQIAQQLTEKYEGEVPKTLEALTEMRGVGRKTANVVLGNAYGIPGLVVDTHVGRISRRLGFTKAADPVKVETEMMPVVPRKDWTLYSHLLIDHGRAVCLARKPRCGDCVVFKLCKRVGVT